MEVDITSDEKIPLQHQIWENELHSAKIVISFIANSNITPFVSTTWIRERGNIKNFLRQLTNSFIAISSI